MNSFDGYRSQIDGYRNICPHSSQESKKEEKVNHPSHYNQGKVETIDILKDFLTEEEFVGFLKGNVLKYLHRYKYKNGLEDLNKASWYLDKLKEQV